MPKYRGPPSPMETVFGVPDRRTLSKKKIQKIKKPKIQKSQNWWSIVVQSWDPFFVLREPHFVLFCFHLFFLSIPFVGGHPFCVVLFSFVVRCPVPWSSVVVVVPYFVLFFRRFVGDAWCVIWHINLYPGRKKIKNFLVLRCWFLGGQLLILAPEQEKKRKTPQGSRREFVLCFSGWSVSTVVDGGSGDLFVFVPCHPVLTVNRSDIRWSS